MVAVAFWVVAYMVVRLVRRLIGHQVVAMVQLAVARVSLGSYYGIQVVSTVLLASCHGIPGDFQAVARQMLWYSRWFPGCC